MSNNADINYIYSNESLLDYAICVSCKMVDLLIENGVVPSIDIFNYAVINKNLPLAKTLLNSKNLDINQANSEGNTPLMYAVYGYNREDNTSFIELLINNNVKVDLKALELAINNKDIGLTDLLLNSDNNVDIHQLN